jgi:hypothetical protein
MGLNQYEVIRTADGNKYLALGDTLVFCLSNEDAVKKEGIYCLRHMGKAELGVYEVVGRLCQTECKEIGTPVISMKDLVVMLSCTRAALDSGMLDLPYEALVVNNIIIEIEKRLGKIGLTVERPDSSS